MRRHLWSLTAASAALATTIALSGCGGAEESSDEVTLRLIAADYDVNGGQSSRNYWSSLIAAFEKEHPRIDVEVTIEPWTDVDRKVARLVEDGKAPDIAQIGSYADYAADGKLYSADQLLSVPVQSNFLRPLVEAGEQRRIQYGLPFATSSRLLFYNKELFAEAGVTEPPETWDELKEAAQQIKDGTDAAYPFALPLGPEEAQIESMLWLLGGGTNGYVEPGGSYTVDSPQNAATFEWLKTDLVGAGLTGPGAPGELNRKEAYAAFTRGEVGMLHGHPSLLKQAKKAGIELGKAPVPGRDGTAKITAGVADWIMGFNQNGNRDEIGEFLNFLFTDENVLDFAAQNDLLPVTSSASQAMEEDPDHDDLKDFLAQMSTALLPPVSKTSWAAVSGDVKEKIGKAVGPDGDPAKVLGEIARTAAEAETQEEEEE
ncbi:extracellular solute-binding protein [Streptomyces jumonjinensis]|uniref:Extracellular solute-binding protein n=1 Tax=Streptomyces jumonjinensis TaxID=1945 RepID=A0A646KPX3_STRJU|nr:extracellular solute-binding protein [Streptomyces jumonjinensis]MQT04342.1 extracellular solute-binding protein [Streptomyces jumonjinensis]